MRGTVTASVPEASSQVSKPHVSQPQLSKQEASKPQRGKAKFPRALRLLRHADFERVYKQGRRHFSASMTVFYRQRPGKETGKEEATAKGLRIGFTVGRALGGAVDRNCIKRRLREAVRLSSPPRSISADIVMNPKKILLHTEFDMLRNEVRRAFDVITQKLARTSDQRNS